MGAPGGTIRVKRQSRARDAIGSTAAHMDETLFGWIHISDLHFGHGGSSYAPNQKLVLEELQRDVAANPAGVRVDAILVTGDVAFSGNGVTADEYARAEAWLIATGKAAGVDPGRIFLVPGNHDVNRNVDKRWDVGPLVESLRAGQRRIDEVLADPKGAELLAARMDAYLTLAGKFAPACLAMPPPVKSPLYWVHTLEVLKARAEPKPLAKRVTLKLAS
jgi:predicted MPP superfamily phosphohydrolase